MLKIVY